jgi:hypothetical protein
MAEMLERCPGGGVRGLVGVTVRHGKTSLLKCAIAWWLKDNPKLRVIYMTYSLQRAQEVGRDIRDLCRTMGITIAKDHDTIMLWETPEGGGVRCMSANQSATGADVDILLVDDPYENAGECDKPEVRQIVDETISYYTMRLNVGGSCVLVMSPWRQDDAIAVRRGRQEETWVYLHKPAISIVDGVEVALAPMIRTLEWLHKQRAVLREQDPAERLWFAQWQCEPIGLAGEDDFVPFARYEMLPSFPGFVDAIGLDMAYSAKRHADWFALVVVRMYAGQMFVRDVMRFKANEGVAESMVRKAWAVYGQCQLYSYMSGPEVGAAHYFASRGMPVNVLPARFNKRIRARRTVDRCRAKDLLLPSQAPWVGEFERRALSWRGLDADEDDEIDGLVSVHDGIYGSGAGVACETLGKPRW